MFVRRGGSAGPTLLLVHGLAANAEVWTGVIALAEQHWHGRWIATDLRGHVRSPSASHYSYGGYAADLAELVADDTPVTVVGHSMGGVVGLMLAGGQVRAGIFAEVAERDNSIAANRAGLPPYTRRVPNAYTTTATEKT